MNDIPAGRSLLGLEVEKIARLVFDLEGGPLTVVNSRMGACRDLLAGLDVDGVTAAERERVLVLAAAVLEARKPKMVLGPPFTDTSSMPAL